MMANDSTVLSPEALAGAAGAEIESALAKARASSARYESDTLRWTVGDTVEKVLATANDSGLVVDRYGNSLSSVGTDDRVAGFSEYGFSADTLQWPLWLALYNDSWVFKRAIDKPAQDAVAAGFSLKNGFDCSAAMAMYEAVKPQFCDGLKWSALFGGAILVMLFSGISPEQMAKPMCRGDLKGRSLRLYATDRWYGVSPSTEELVKDFSDPDFGKPKYYGVAMADGTNYRIHHSWVVRLEHRGAPNLVKLGYLQGWGYAEGSHIINELARDDQLKSSITSLVNKSLIEVVKMSGMRGVFMGTDKGNEAQLRKRLEMVNWGRTYNSLTFLDKDDEYQQYQLTGLSGLAELMEKNMWLVAAALEMQGVLFGDLKGGLSQESDAWQRYCSTIHTRAEQFALPAWQKLMSAIFAACGYKGPTGKTIKPKVEVGWLDSAERAKARAENAKSVADLLSKLEQDGIISKKQYAETIRAYVQDGRLAITFTPEHVSKLELEEEAAILETIQSLGRKNRSGREQASQMGFTFSNPSPLSGEAPPGGFGEGELEEAPSEPIAGGAATGTEYEGEVPSPEVPEGGSAEGAAE